MKVLLTGGAGYIGSHASLALLDNGHKVTIVDNLSTGNQNLLPLNAEFIKCDIQDKTVIANLLRKEKFDILMHFAGYIQVEESVNNPEKYFRNNTENAKILFDICAENNLTNIIFSSTAAAYGNPTNEQPVSENNVLKPLNPYGESKIQTEEYLQNNPKLNYMILRYFNVAGADPQMRSGLISQNPTHLIKIASEVAVGKRDKIIIYGNDYPTLDGTAIRDYIHVSDLADVHLKAAAYLLKEQKSQIINCGYGKGYSVKEVLAVVNKINGKEISIEDGDRRPGDSSMLVSNITKLNNLLKWKPKHNDLNFIIKTAIDWEKKLLNR
jgi:UDP-glucose 4-epimerase|tara:strand:- start:89 stop:1063 length:975 start_codon:yes stop_codon:yes gene_type:complete